MAVQTRHSCGCAQRRALVRASYTCALPALPAPCLCACLRACKATVSDLSVKKVQAKGMSCRFWIELLTARLLSFMNQPDSRLPAWLGAESTSQIHRCAPPWRKPCTTMLTKYATARMGQEMSSIRESLSWSASRTCHCAGTQHAMPVRLRSLDENGPFAETGSGQTQGTLEYSAQRNTKRRRVFVVGGRRTGTASSR